MSIWHSLLWGCFALARAVLCAFPRAVDAPPPRVLSRSGTHRAGDRQQEEAARA